MDEFTRECLAIEVATSLPAARVITVLAHLVATYGPPEYLHSDNGPEFVAHAIQGWLAIIGLLIEITFIATFTNRFFAR